MSLATKGKAGGNYFQIGQKLYRANSELHGTVVKVDKDWNGYTNLERATVERDDKTICYFTSDMLRQKAVWTRNMLREAAAQDGNVDLAIAHVPRPPEVMAIGSRLYTDDCTLYLGAIEAIWTSRIGMAPPEQWCRTSFNTRMAIPNKHLRIGKRNHEPQTPDTNVTSGTEQGSAGRTEEVTTVEVMA